MSTVDTALSLAAIQWFVFPCSADGRPLVKWGDEASTDPATIKRWFRRDDRRIGIHTGKSGLVVVDLDRKGGRDGFAALKDAGLRLPRSFRYTSRSGKGRHEFYAAPADADLTIATDVLGLSGVDIRAGVGMIVYNGPALAEAPHLAKAPEWALVHRQERAYDAVSLEAWLAEERSPEPGTKALSLAEAVPLRGVGNADLLPLLTPLVDAVLWGRGRRQAYDLARERYTRHYSDSGEAFDRAWEKAVARVEDDWHEVMHEPATARRRPARAHVERAAHEGGGRRTLQLTPASAIKPRPVFWLWDGRLALGTLGLLAGREGIGKSTAAYWVVAQVTRGLLPGESHGKPKSVLIAATEDSWEHTIVPRLMAARADLDRVYRVEVCTADDIHVGLSLPHDLRQLEDAALATDAGLLLLDPLMSRLGDLDTHRDSEVRIGLEPLVAVADRTGMSVLGIMHHNKSGSTDPLQLIMASKAFTAVARSVHTVIVDPDDDTGQRRLFGSPKNNLGRDDLPTLSFTIESAPVRTDEGTAWTGRIVWGEERTESIGSVMDRAGSEADHTVTGEAAGWLQDYLELNGPIASSKVKEHGKIAGHSEAALQRARKRIQVAVTQGGYPRVTFWDVQDRAVVAGARGEETTTTTETTSAAVGAVAPVVPVVSVVAGARARKPTKRTHRTPRVDS